MSYLGLFWCIVFLVTMPAEEIPNAICLCIQLDNYHLLHLFTTITALYVFS